MTTEVIFSSIINKLSAYKHQKFKHALVCSDKLFLFINRMSYKRKRKYTNYKDKINYLIQSLTLFDGRHMGGFLFSSVTLRS